MDVYTVLMNDHRAAAQLLERIERARKLAASERAELFATLRNELQAHSHAEHRVFYAELRQAGFASLIDEAEREHERIDALLQEIEAIEVLDERWMPRFAELARCVRHHVEDEETRIFARARTVFNDHDARELGKAMLQETERELGEFAIEHGKSAYHASAPKRRA